MKLSEIEIGSRVILKTGILTPANVVGIIDSRLYNQIMLNHCDKYWSLIDPEWKDKPVIYVQFDQPYRNASFEEYCNGLKENEEFQQLDEELKKYYYCRNVPEVYFTQAPIDNAELI